MLIVNPFSPGHRLNAMVDAHLQPHLVLTAPSLRRARALIANVPDVALVDLRKARSFVFCYGRVC